MLPLAGARARRVPAPPQEPAPLPYLREEPWAFDLALEVELNGEVVSRTNARHLYWSVAQQVAHLTVNGASLRTGDLLASGTISGPEPDARGSFIELTWNGAEPIELAGGSTRTFLEDGDEVVLRGAGLGEVRGPRQRPLNSGWRFSWKAFAPSREVLRARAQLLHRDLELERRGERRARGGVHHALGEADRHRRAGEQLVDQRLGHRAELLDRRRRG